MKTYNRDMTNKRVECIHCGAKGNVKVKHDPTSTGFTWQCPKCAGYNGETYREKETAEYNKGFEVGRKVAEGFHKGTMNNRDRGIAILSPYAKTDPQKYADFRRGRLDGDTDYWKGKESITPYGINI